MLIFRFGLQGQDWSKGHLWDASNCINSSMLYNVCVPVRIRNAIHFKDKACVIDRDSSRYEYDGHH